MPHPHLIILRTVATLLLSAVIAQAGFAAAGIARDQAYLGLHAIGAWVTLILAVGCGVVYTALRRTAGTLLVALAWAMAGLVTVQFTLGRLQIADVHIFTGVLTAMLATALTSWTYRHPMPAAA